MLNKTKNIFDNSNFNIFASQICEALKGAFETFFEQDVKVVIQAVNDFREVRNEKLIKQIDFFTSQIKVENHKPVLIRLSSEFVENVFENILKTNNRAFRLSNITPLEIKILNSFCEFAYKRLNDVLISTKEVKISEKSEKNINLLFLICPNDNVCSKIMLSIPQDRINLTPLKKVTSFTDEDFYSSSATIRLKAGSSKITFEELQNLTPDDIIILENSVLNKMALISGDVETKFNIKINSSLVVDIGDDEEDEQGNIQTYNEVIMSKNLWDDIQIEINAEFEKVKMTIGELKQITQGQIVDLGSVFDNEISLFVENRKVATGELIIINDRYAVRLNEILNSNTSAAPIDAKVDIGPKPAAAQPQAPKAAAPQAAKPAAAPQARPAAPKAQAAKPAAAPKPQAAQEDEEFDYSDFEK